MRQGTSLNQSDQPAKREQAVPLPTSPASADQVTALASDVAALQAQVTGLHDYLNDAAAAAGGIVVGQFYRNGSVVMVRVT